MKLSVLALSSLLALVAAQESSSTSSSAASATTSLSPAESCVVECDAKDRCCKAQCLGVPCPSDQMANDTNTCVAECDQGSGSPEDTQAYAQCQARCYTTHYFPATGTVTNAPSGSSTNSGSATTTGSSSDDSNNSDNSDNSDDSNSGSETSSSATASATDGGETNAAAINNLQFGVSAASLGGFLLAAWAL